MQLLFKIHNDIRYKETDKWPNFIHAFWSSVSRPVERWVSAIFSPIVRRNLPQGIYIIIIIIIPMPK